MKTCKSLLSAFIVISILCLSLGVAAATEVASGSCGTNVNWSLDSNGVLIISGEGDITSSPWVNSWVKSVIIEEGVTSICKNAFYNCDSLASVTIPSSVNFIGAKAFDSCDKLKKVYAADIESWCNIQFENYGATPTHNGAYLYFNNIIAKNITIPDTIKVIKDYAFYNCNSLENITIPEGVTSIGNRSFYFCGSITSITIPKTIASIGISAFYNCTNLKEVYAADIESWCNIQFEEASSNPLLYEANLYLNDIIAKNITIPSTVKEINDYAFYGCDSLESITIPEGVTSIGDWAFIACYSLTTVTLPSTIESIGVKAFNGCYNITDVYYYGTEAEWDNNVYVGGNNDNLKNAQFHYMKVVQPDGINIDKTELSLLVGEAGVITAAVSPYNSTYKSVSWASSDESVATVSASGTVTAVAPGTATITATTAVGGFSASCTVTVTEPIKQGYKVNSITIKDGKGNKLSKIPANSFLATVSITNIDADSETVLVLAQYKKNGAFAKLLYVTVDEMPVDSTIKFTMPIDNPDGTVYRLKAFCWEDFTSAKPIGEAVTVY